MGQKRPAPEGRKVAVVVGVSLVVLIMVTGITVFIQQWGVVGKVAAQCQPLPEGAVSWFNGEKIGSTANFVDKLLNNIMVAAGTVNSVAGLQGDAFGFTNTAMDYTVFSAGGLDKNQGTVEMWVKPTWTGSDNAEHGIWQLYALANPNVLFTLFKTGAAPLNTLTFRIINGGSVNFVSTDASTLFQNPDEWTHLAATWLESPTGDDKIKLYVDGALVAEESYSFIPSIIPAGGALGTAKLDIASPPDSFYNGLIDEVRFYNRALEPLEINQIYQTGAAGICPFESNCADGEDDDEDGLVDCGDADCAEHPACGSAQETGDLFCHNGEDDDDDDFIDCFDSSCFLDDAPGDLGNGDSINNCFDKYCYDDQQCNGQGCLTAGGSNGVVVWSYRLPAETSVQTQGQTPEWTGCCAANQCWYGAGTGECVDIDATKSSKALLCDTDRNWYSCQEEGQLSTGGTYECVAGLWKVHCSAKTKYWLEDNTRKICDGENWRNCVDLAVSPILDLNVDIDCVGATPATSTITIKEMNCNNGLDDDNDKLTDEEDNKGTIPDCLGNKLFDFFGDPWYEVRLEDDDSFRVTLRKK